MKCRVTFIVKISFNIYLLHYGNYYKNFRRKVENGRKIKAYEHDEGYLRVSWNFIFNDNSNDTTFQS